jgi:integrase
LITSSSLTHRASLPLGEMPLRPSIAKVRHVKPHVRAGRQQASHIRAQATAYRTALGHHGIPLCWSTSRHPTLQDITCLRTLLPADRYTPVLSPPAGITLMEAADCRGPPADMLFDNLAATLDNDVAAFNDLVQPSAQAHNTRAAYYTHWRSFVTYAMVHDKLDKTIPAEPGLLKGYLWSLLRCGLKPGSITLHLYAIIDRHARFRVPFPFSNRDVKGWLTAFARLCGTPKLDKLAITATHLKSIMSLPRPTLTTTRDTLIVALGTVCAMRVSELVDLDVCDVLFDFDAPHVAAIRIKKRKNDQKRAGLWPRLGPAHHPQFDIQALLREWMQRAELHVHAGCEKGQYPRSSCRACGRLFSRIRGTSGTTYTVGETLHGMTKDTVRKAIHTSLRRVGCDPSGFSGISLRRGGLSAAVEAGVPSELYQLQSGHASDCWKHYVRGGSVDQLLRFHGAFGL